jgi:hypothetical protein
MFCSFLIGSEAKLRLHFLGYFLGLLILFVPNPLDFTRIEISQYTIPSASRVSSIALHNAGASRVEVRQLAEHRKAAVKRTIFCERTDYRKNSTVIIHLLLLFALSHFSKH